MSDTPDNPYAPLLNILATTGPLVASSLDIKTMTANLGIPWAAPLIGTTCLVVGVATGLNWFYRRAIGRDQRWALWLRDLMPWNRTRYV